MYSHYDYSTMFDPSEILIYLRKSRSDDPLMSVEEVLSKHETILDEWCDRNLKNRIDENNRYREVVSGETISDRPEVQKVLQRIESPGIRAILCVEVQRLSRGDLEDAGKLIKLLRYSETYVITPQKTYDLRDEYDRDIFERELKRGNEFLEYQKKIMNRGRLLSVSQGNYIASIPPYGYDKTFVMEGNRKCPVLIENTEQSSIVRLIYNLYVEKDYGCQKIANHLEELHIAPPKGKYWSPAAIKDMLSNVHYIGKVKWNWRKTVNIIEDGELIETRPKSKEGDYLIYDGKHQAIISDELFEMAQAKRGRNTRISPSKEIRNPLAGLVYCHCGRAMTYRTYRDKDGKDRCSPRLLCDNQTRCHTGSCTHDELLAIVEQTLREYIVDFEVKLQEDDNSIEIHDALIKNLENKLKELRAKELMQWEMQSDPDERKRMPLPIFQQLNAKLQQEKTKTEDTLKKAMESAPRPIDYKNNIARFSEALDALYDDAVSPAKKNQLLKACIKKITYKREAPQRLTRCDEPKGTVFEKSGSHWSTPPIEVDIELNINFAL